MLVFIVCCRVDLQHDGAIVANGVLTGTAKSVDIKTGSFELNAIMVVPSWSVTACFAACGMLCRLRQHQHSTRQVLVQHGMPFSIFSLLIHGAGLDCKSDSVSPNWPAAQ
jgi:hypothetical protein